MRRSFQFILAGGCFSLLASCSDRLDRSVSQDAGQIPQGAFALVAGEALSLGLLAEVDQKRRLHEARSLVQLSLYGRAADEATDLIAPSVERAVLARKYVEQLEGKLLSERPVQQDELVEQRKIGWLKYDRPRSVRTVALLIPTVPLTPFEAEFKLANQLAKATAHALNVESFVTRAQAVETEIEVIPQALPPLAEDGRVVPVVPQDTEYRVMDEDLARAATALQRPGEMSGVVGTRQGFYLLFCMEVLPAQKISLQEAREELTKAAFAARVQKALVAIKTKQVVPVVKIRDDVANLLQSSRQD